jgi:hypothetical protein
MDQPTTTETRPDFMIALGLLPPYSADDVHKAYKARALVVHPDRGGAAADFLKLQEAHDRALDYVKFQEGRRSWLATQVEPYLKQQELIASIERSGGKVEVDSIEWVERSFGDFAALVERLRTIVLHDCAEADAVLKYLAQHAEQLGYLRTLDLAGSEVTDAGLNSLPALHGIERLDLSGTRVTAAGLKSLSALRHLRWVRLAGSSLSWWARWRVKQRLRGVEIVF